MLKRTFLYTFLVKRVVCIYVKMYELKAYVKNIKIRKIFINKGCENRNG